MFLGHFGLALGAKRVAPGPSLGVVLAALFLASTFGPPPPSADAVAITAVAGWLFVAWGYWIDRHRAVAKSSPG
jgi:hypothetical protein